MILALIQQLHGHVAGRRLCCLASVLSNIRFGANPFFRHILEGVTPPSRILHADSTSERECTSQKTEKNHAYTVCTKPQIFSTLGAPISRQGADIHMLSPPSDRGRRRLKIRSDPNFSYGHSKAVSSSGEVFANFSQTWHYVWGAGAQPPPHRAFRSLIH